jgi:hypothetical protein
MVAGVAETGGGVGTLRLGPGAVDDCEGEELGFFFLPRFPTLVHVSPKGLPARVGKSSSEGGAGGEGLRVAMGGSEKWTWDVVGAGWGMAPVGWAGGRAGSVGRGRVKNSLMNTKFDSERGRDFL